MPSSKNEHRFTIRDDGRPLRTKVVATLGDPKGYPNGLVDLNGKEVKTKRLSYRKLLDEYARNGVDVVRLNLSHQRSTKDLRRVFRSVKRAILAAEAKHPDLKRISVLADLPGPKIRFNIRSEIAFEVGARLDIVFDRECSSATEQTVYIDQSPLRIAMDRLDNIRSELGSYDDPWPEGDSEARRREVSENILGYSMASDSARQGLFERLMGQVSARLANGESVLVFIGEADVVLELDAKAFDPREAVLPCRVTTVRTSPIRGRKGFTIKGIDIDIPTFTKQDKDFLDAVLDEDIRDGDPASLVCAFIGLSFAQTADDVLRARQFIEDKLVRDADLSPEAARLRAPWIVAKIETYRGWENRRYILDVADGVMVARGDLGLQVDIEKVPDIQKRLIALCNKRGKPVITATQMLTSMTGSIEPTRAEVSDVFNAIQDGTDAVMLSEETAIGRFPFHALRKMVAIAIKAESYFELDGIPDPELRIEMRRKRIADFLKDDHIRISKNKTRLASALEYVGKGWGRLLRDQDKQLRRLHWRRELYLEKHRKMEEQETTNRITEATCTMAEAQVVSAIVAATTSGRTVRMLSRLRPRVAVIGAAHDALAARKLAISYGVLPIWIGSIGGAQEFDALFSQCQEAILGHEYLGHFLAERTVIFTGGFPLETPGTTNMLQIRKLSGRRPGVS